MRSTADSSLPVAGAGRPGKQEFGVSSARVRLSIAALSVCHLVTFLDQLGVSTALPTLAADLGTGTSTSWIGASFLMATTVLQLSHGPLSDMAGRRNLLAACLVLLGVGDLGCGFSKTRYQFFVCRGIAGVGSGGVSSLSMVVMLDITIKYQGVIGTVVTLSNAVSPIIGGAIVQTTSWRWVFWIISMVAIPAAPAAFVILPLKRTPRTAAQKARKLDYVGMLLSLVAALLVLVPIAGAGVDYSWASPRFVAPVPVGIVLCLLFLLYEWKVAHMPIVRLGLFRAPHCWALYLQAFLTGSSYFGNFSYLPIYFQTILKFSPLAAGGLVLSVVVPTSIASFLSGQYIARRGNYMHCILLGFILRAAGNGLTLLFDRDTSVAILTSVLVVEGLGIGFSLQPILLGIYANNPSKDRGATTGLRNYIRTIGGASGLLASGAILSNILNQDLYDTGIIDKNRVTALTSSTFLIEQTALSDYDKNVVLDVFMKGLHYIFIYHTVCSGLCLVLTIWVGNTKLMPAKHVDPIPGDGDAVNDVEMEKLLVQLKHGPVT